MKEIAEVAGCDGMQSNSIENQKEYIEEFLKTKSEIITVEFYMDDGYSGVNFERPSFQKMMQDIRENKIDCIIVKNLSRFGRNYLEVGDYLEQIFPFLGVRFIGINDGYDSKNFSGQTSGMDIAFQNFIYEMYSKDLSGKVKSAVSTSMKRGEYHAGCIVYGYEKSADGKGMVIDSEAAAVIRRIFQEVDSCLCENIVDFAQRYGKLEAFTEEFMNEMVERITVYEDNRIEIVWRYGDEFEKCLEDILQ